MAFLTQLIKLNKLAVQVLTALGVAVDTLKTGVAYAVKAGTADKANKLTDARKISLDGVVTGNGKFDGSADVTIDTSIATATKSKNGLMSSDDKEKLDGIAKGAQVNVLESVKVNGNALTVTSKGVNIDLSEYAKTKDFASALTYKGTVATYSALPTTNQKVGDVYNVTTADASHNLNAGENVAWNGSAWDNLGGVTDLSNMVDKTGTGATGTWGINVSGNSATANKLATARTISLTGNVTGSATFDGSANISIATTDSSGVIVILNTVGLSHNGIYRGKDLTDYFNSGEMSTAIAAGTFKDIYIGDYITKSITVDGTTYNVKWVVADFDYYYGAGDSECTTHHVVMIPYATVQVNVNMNDTNVTTGGYVGSNMWTVNMPLYKDGIINAFGESHVVKHRELLSNAISTTVDSMAGAGWTGATTGWAWTDVYVNIPNEPMIYGCTAFSSSGFDVGESNKQLALFRFERFSKGRKWFWLRAAASGSRFCYADGYGYATCLVASYRTSYGGIRPYFLLR